MQDRPWSIATCPAAWAMALACFAAPAAAAAGDAPALALHALFDARWEAQMRTYPEWASYTGDNRYGDRLFNASPAAIAANYDATRGTLAQALAIPRETLSATDRTSLELFVYQLEADLRLEPFVGWRSMSLGALGGFQSDFAELLRIVPVSTEAEARQLLARMDAYPRRVDQELVRLRAGLALGWVPPRPVLQRVLAQLDAELAPPLSDSPFFEPFTRLGKDIAPIAAQALRADARQAIEQQVLPALRRLRQFVQAEYLPAAPPDGALLHYPDGPAVYAELVRQQTTTDLTPQQIHATGLREVERLHAQMLAVMKEARFDGDFAAFVKWLNTDPKFFFDSADALLAGYRDIAKRIDPELPKLFAVLPRAPYGVQAMPAHFGPDRAEFYIPPALDGSRAGWFNANALAYRTRARWGMETLVAHETVPGHHLQIARAIELGDLPRFRRDAFFTAYTEGWALYAETLGFDLGLYRDPYSRFGHLQGQAFRAARLVVDTGIHALGWSRQRAIDYMVEQTGLDAEFIASEVDRYTSDPAQALAYMVGELKIIELRDRAKARLGPRFDIRRFHMAVLDGGAVPLPVLQQVVDAWIAAIEASAR